MPPCGLHVIPHRCSFLPFSHRCARGRFGTGKESLSRSLFPRKLRESHSAKPGTRWSEEPEPEPGERQKSKEANDIGERRHEDGRGDSRIDLELVEGERDQDS